jgi:sulfite exporter TauE/SafE
MAQNIAPAGGGHCSSCPTGSKEKLPWFSPHPADYKNFFLAVLILIFLYGVAKWLGIFNAEVSLKQDGLFVALIVGLTAGVSTCMALVGGLVLALSARHAELHPEATAKEKFRPHLYFNLGRVLGYAFLGGLIGWLGSVFKPSPFFLGLITMAVGGVMIVLGLKLVEIFPVFKNKTLTLPVGLSRALGLDRESREYSHKGAMITGVLTFFLPCGFTQAMQLYAVSTGGFWSGAVIMFLFALGTAPGLLGIGGLSAIFKGQKAKIFFATAGLAVILLGWFNLVNGSRLIGSQPRVSNPDDNSATVSGEVQEIKMTEDYTGYTPRVLTVKAGVPVRWIITAKAPYSCAASLVVPSYGINKQLKPGENIIEFTPKQIGEIPFSCSMGMYRGKLIVE